MTQTRQGAGRGVQLRPYGAGFGQNDCFSSGQRYTFKRKITFNFAHSLSRCALGARLRTNHWFSN